MVENMSYEDKIEFTDLLVKEIGRYFEHPFLFGLMVVKAPEPGKHANAWFSNMDPKISIEILEGTIEAIKARQNDPEIVCRKNNNQ